MIKILNVNADWTAAKNECRNTVNKEPTDNTPSKQFIHNLLISEHSPIRLITIRWSWPNIKSWVATHFSRHWLGWDKWISTQRSDRTGVNRDNSPQDTLVKMDVNANAQALINVSRFRLCYQASPETRSSMEELKVAIHDIANQEELSDVMVPNCVYRCGCPEFKTCGYWEKFEQWATSHGYNMMDIHERYECYNNYFYSRRNINDRVVRK